MIIDFHTHVFPDKIAAKAVSSLQERAKLPVFADGTVTGLIHNMEKAGIDLSVVLPVVTAPRQFRSITDFACQINREQNSLLSFGGIHPLSPNWKEELSELHQLGFKGIKLHPDYQNFFADDLACIELVRQAAAYNMIVVFHSGLDLGLPEPIHCTPQRAASLLRALDGYDRIVFAHCGASHMAEEVLKHLSPLPCYFDLSFDLARESLSTVDSIIDHHGVSRCLFATDSPWTDPCDSLEKLSRLSLNSEEKDLILGGNAMRLLDLNEKV